MKSASATNMATMLSGFSTIGVVTLKATVSLTADGNTLAGDPNRGPQELLKNLIDQANNNTNFGQPTPCSSPFA